MKSTSFKHKAKTYIMDLQTINLLLLTESQIHKYKEKRQGENCPLVSVVAILPGIRVEAAKFK